jgi:Protein of unknown function (DUF3761)
MPRRLVVVQRAPRIRWHLPRARRRLMNKLTKIMAGLAFACVGLAAPANACAYVDQPSGVPASPIPLVQCPPGYYSNSYGNCVERPDQNPSNAPAICCDGSNSHSQHRSGTCSHHGGVCQWNSFGRGARWRQPATAEAAARRANRLKAVPAVVHPDPGSVPSLPTPSHQPQLPQTQEPS